MTTISDSAARVPFVMGFIANGSSSTWDHAAYWRVGPSAGTVISSENRERGGAASLLPGHGHAGETVRQLHSFLQMGPNWDTHGADPISDVAAQSAVAFLLSSRAHAKPAIVPTGKGGIQLEWHDGRVDVEIEILSSGQASLFAFDAITAEQRERWVVPGHPAIESWLDRLRVSTPTPGSRPSYPTACLGES